MEWFKKHTDTVIIISAIAGAMIWTNGKFNDIDRRLVRIETIMIMKGIMPSELVVHNDKKLNQE